MSLIAQAVWKWSLTAAGGLSGLVLAGCLAQQADVKNQKLELQKSIRESKTELQKSISESKAEMKTEMDRIVRETRARLNEDISQIRERELAALRGDVEKRAHEEDKLRRSQDDIRSELSQAANKLRKELTEQSNLVTASRQELKLEQDRFRNEIKAEQDRLRSDQERFRNDFKEAVTKDLSKLSGDSTAQVAKLSIRLDEIAARLATTENIFKKVSERLEKVSERLDEQQRDIKNAEAKSAGLTQKLDAQDKNVADLRQALGDFKQALSGLGDKIVNQDKVATDLSGSVNQQASVLAKRLDGLSAKLDADMKSMTTHVNEVNKTTAAHLEDVNKSVNTVAKALESAGDRFVSRLEEQDRRLDELGKYVTGVQEFTKRVEQQGPEYAKVVSRLEEQDRRLDELTKYLTAVQEFTKRVEQQFADRTAHAVPAPCSGAGEIFGTHVYDGSLSVVVAQFERTQMASAAVSISSPKDSFQVGQDLAKKLNRSDLCGLFVLTDGLQVNGTSFINGINQVVGKDVVVTGGMAGDGTRFEKTWTLLDGKPTTGQVTAIGFYGKHLRIGHGSHGGWDIFGPERIVTKSAENILYELDGRPALQLY